MIDRAKILDLLKAGKKVTVELNSAEVTFAKSELRAFSHYRSGYLNKIIVRDSILGSIYFGGFSDKLRTINCGDKVSLKVTITGVGDATERYPDPILFAVAQTRGRDSVKVDAKVSGDGNDLSINV